MTITIAIILGVIAALVIGLLLLLLLLNMRAKSQASLTAVVDIYPSGKSHVEFIPSSNLEDQKLMKLALLYAAKIRYVQSEDHPEVVEMYEGLIDEVIAASELSDKGAFLERLSDATALVQTQDEAPAATKTGERFTIRLVEGRSTDYIQNDLPLRGLAANLPISVLLLAHAVAVRLSEHNVFVFERAFLSLQTAMFDGRKPQLFALNQAALDALEAAS